MALADIRAAIKAKWLTVTGIGQVHDYERYATRSADFLALYKTGTPPNERISGGFFYREATAERDLGLGEVRRIHRWRMTYFLGLEDADATGKLIDDLVEETAEVFRADLTLGGLVLHLKDMAEPAGPVGIQVERIEPVRFQDVLCHRAALALLTETTAPNV